MKSCILSLNQLPKQRLRGFTLVEMMIVVVIVGLLAVLAIPALQKAKEGSYKSRLSNDFRQFTSAFETYAMENGEWPDDENPGVLPSVMKGYIVQSNFEEKTLMNGQWDWEGPGAFAFVAGISLREATTNDEFMTRLDQAMDDGALASGHFQKIEADVYTYILEE